MRKKRMNWCILVLLLAFLWKGDVYASENKAEDYVLEQMNEIDFREIQKQTGKLFPAWNVDIEKAFDFISKGEIIAACKLVYEGVTDGVKSEFAGLRELIISILLIGIFSALFSNFADMFSGQKIAQVGFYFLYLFLMAVLTGAFSFVSRLAQNTMENIVTFVKLYIPTYFMSVGVAVGASTAVSYYQVMLVIVYIVESFLLKGILPFIYSYVILALLNGIWAEERLALLLDILKKGILMAMKLSVGAITGLSLVQAAILPMVDGLKMSTLQKAVSIIPGIGNAAEGVGELVIGAAVLIKNSLGVLILLLLIAFCVMPLLKIFAIAGIVKLGAALTGIISDKRISGCADRVGEGCFLLMRCVFTAGLLFVIVIAVTAYMLGGFHA